MLPSLRMGRYIVDGLLGPGGVTETYLVRLEEASAVDRVFALKLLRRDRFSEKALVEATTCFVAAGRRLLGFRRQGFAKVVEVCEDPDATFIVSELVPGRDLGHLLAMSKAEAERPGVDPLLVGLLGAEIARLLQVAHTSKPALLHLGLSPHNVVVTDEGEVVLLDAGIAASIRDLTEQPVERMDFVAPELMHGRLVNERQGVAADLYALGALLYNLLTGGRVPLTSGGQTTDLPLPEVSPRLAAALRSLLAAWWEERPESAVAVIDRLAGGIGSVPKRQRAIADGLRRAEKEARDAAASARPGSPVTVQLPSPADSMLDDAFARAVPGLGKPHGRRRLWAASAFAALGLLAAGLSLAGASGFQLFGRPQPGPLAAALEEKTDGVPAGVRASPNDPVALSRQRIRARLRGHLVAETLPPGATVWVDGVRRGMTFADVEVGPGEHRVVFTLPGFHSFRDVVDTGRGAIIRRNLVPREVDERGFGFVRVECQTVGKFPILIDDEETGFVCPELRMPAPAGKHTVAIYLPASGRIVSVAVSVELGGRAVAAKFSE